MIPFKLILSDIIYIQFAYILKIQCMYSRACVDLTQPLVFEPVVSAKTVGGTEGLVTLSTWVLLQDLQYKWENA